MTISSVTDKTIGAGNGATTVFSFNFLIQSAAQLAVIYTDANGNQTPISAGNYSVAFTPGTPGGTVTYNPGGTPIASGTTLTMYRTVALTQLTNLRNQGSYNPTVVEAALDYLTMIAQQVSETVGRGISVPIVDANPVVTLPAQAARKNTTLGFDANGTLTLLASLGSTPISGYMTTILTQATAALARGYLGSTATGDALFTAASVSAAMAVLGAALDSAVVHNTGNENIAGIKTFGSAPVLPTNSITAAMAQAFGRFQIFTAGGTPFTPLKTGNHLVLCIGGGGGGGAGAGVPGGVGSQYGPPGNGGGAGEMKWAIVSLTASVTEAITIGTAGTKGTAGSGQGPAGTDGGATTFGTTVTVTAAGGKGGRASGFEISAGGGAVFGSSGSNGGGYGGGQGGAPTAASDSAGQAASDATGPGAGGGGGGGASTAAATAHNGGNGGNGMTGLIIVFW